MARGDMLDQYFTSFKKKTKNESNARVVSKFVPDKPKYEVICTKSCLNGCVVTADFVAFFRSSKIGSSTTVSEHLMIFQALKKAGRRNVSRISTTALQRRRIWLSESSCNFEDSHAVAFHKALLLTAGERMVVTSRPSWVGDVVCRMWGERGSVFDLSSQLREELSTIKPESDELRLLAQEFFLTGTMTSDPDQRMLECVKMLCHSELISWIDLLRIVTGFTQFQKSDVSSHYVIYWKLNFLIYNAHFPL
ncbi:hypothetical protein KIN20_016054 [Parelaphostrongylus tenuis]|uniref:Uncharacterized protein n=1 Tax=Parelaphostrongylus tenuis TaxID=148309 RepID=A0AAD5N1I7_PARTN|nr:hypothetical protein KIN20_016054 [Parelaphostrongylus tenuis]